MFIKLAWRNLLRNQRRSVLTAVAIGAAVSFVMVTLTFLDGMASTFEEELLSQIGHIQIIHPQYVRMSRLLSIEHIVEEVSLLKKSLEQIDGVSEVRPTLTFGATIDVPVENDLEELNQHAVIVHSFPAESGVSNKLKQSLVSGAVSDLITKEKGGPKRLRKMAIGTEAAKHFGECKIGQRLTLIAQARSRALIAADFEVAAIVDLQAKSLNSHVYVPLHEIRNLLALNDSATSVLLFLENPNESATIKGKVDELLASLARKYEAFAWYENGGVVTYVKANYLVAASIFFIILIVAAIVVSNTMAMTVLERTNEIGLLAALGFQRKDLLTLFLMEALLIAFCGCLLGLPLGGAGSYILVKEGVHLSGTHDAPFVAREKMYGRFGPHCVGWAVGLGFAVAALATFVPVVRGTSMRPSDALRPR